MACFFEAGIVIRRSSVKYIEGLSHFNVIGDQVYDLILVQLG